MERREAKRPDRKGRETPQKRLGVPIGTHHGCLARTLRLSALYSPRFGDEGFPGYGATGAAKHTDGGAMTIEMNNCREHHTIAVTLRRSPSWASLEEPAPDLIGGRRPGYRREGWGRASFASQPSGCDARASG